MNVVTVETSLFHLHDYNDFPPYVLSDINKVVQADTTLITQI